MTHLDMLTHHLSGKNTSRQIRKLVVSHYQFAQIERQNRSRWEPERNCRTPWRPVRVVAKWRVSNNVKNKCAQCLPSVRPSVWCGPVCTGSNKGIWIGPCVCCTFYTVMQDTILFLVPFRPVITTANVIQMWLWFFHWTDVILNEAEDNIQYT
jgi:hypothetical protein